MEGKMQKWIVTIEQDEDGCFIVECPAIPGCVSQGRTEEEALKNIQDAIASCLEVRVKEGMPLTVETRLIEVAT
jgi:predicted RNase H-like HicB family nuclease